MPLTHELLLRHIGTSREMVSHCMNQFQKQGYLRDSRQEIVLYRDALAAWIARPDGTDSCKLRKVTAQTKCAGQMSADVRDSVNFTGIIHVTEPR